MKQATVILRMLDFQHAKLKCTCQNRIKVSLTDTGDTTLIQCRSAVMLQPLMVNQVTLFILLQWHTIARLKGAAANVLMPDTTADLQKPFGVHASVGMWS